jgi:hypothetical protein
MNLFKQRIAVRIAQIAALSLMAMTAGSEELLQAKVMLQDDQATVFSVSGTSREDIIGGQIKLGEHAYSITKQSRLGLIGGHRPLTDLGPNGVEYALFSSSFSAQTAVGNPWVSAQDYRHCEQPYNAFLAVYQVKDSTALTPLGPIPYPLLAEGKGEPEKAVVYCFYAEPPG